MESPFAKDDLVYVRAQRTKESYGPRYKVLNPMDPTDMKRINGDAVGFYVRIQKVPDKASETPPVEGYHASSLIKVSDV